MSSIQYTLVSFSVVIFLLFIIISVISIWQYTKYKIVDGTAICEDNIVDRCLLVFNYLTQQNEQKTKVSPISFQEIQQSGIFSVKVAYSLDKNGTDANDYFLIGSPFHVFLGTKNMLLIYITLTFFAGLICISFLPGLYKQQKK